MIEFGGCLIERDEDPTLLVCKEKNVKVVIEEIKTFFVTKQTRLVGWNEDPNCSLDQKYLDMWELEGFVHIGCLREPKESFNHKYIELLKILNRDNESTNQKEEYLAEQHA